MGLESVHGKAANKVDQNDVLAQQTSKRFYHEACQKFGKEWVDAANFNQKDLGEMAAVATLGPGTCSSMGPERTKIAGGAIVSLVAPALVGGVETCKEQFTNHPKETAEKASRNALAGVGGGALWSINPWVAGTVALVGGSIFVNDQLHGEKNQLRNGEIGKAASRLGAMSNSELIESAIKLKPYLGPDAYNATFTMATCGIGVKPGRAIGNEIKASLPPDLFKQALVNTLQMLSKLPAWLQKQASVADAAVKTQPAGLVGEKQIKIQEFRTGAVNTVHYDHLTESNPFPDRFKVQRADGTTIKYDCNKDVWSFKSAEGLENTYKLPPHNYIRVHTSGDVAAKCVGSRIILRRDGRVLTASDEGPYLLEKSNGSIEIGTRGMKGHASLDRSSASNEDSQVRFSREHKEPNVNDHLLKFDPVNQARTLAARGNTLEAKQMLQSQIASSTKYLGKDHDQVSRDLDALSQVLRQRGELNAAEKCEKTAIDKSISGNNPEEAYLYVHNLQRLKTENNSQVDMANVYKQFAEAISQKNGPINRETLFAEGWSLSNRARLAAEANDLSLSQKLSEESIDRFLKLGSHPNAAIVAKQMANAFREAGLLSKAESYMEKTVGFLRQDRSGSIVVEHDYKAALDTLTNIHTQLKQYDKAIDCLMESTGFNSHREIMKPEGGRLSLDLKDVVRLEKLYHLLENRFFLGDPSLRRNMSFAEKLEFPHEKFCGQVNVVSRLLNLYYGNKSWREDFFWMHNNLSEQ